MLRARELALRPVIALARRRVWLVLIAFTAGIAAGVWAWYRIPAQYRSETRIGVVSATVPDVQVKGDEATARMRSTSENILTDSRLKPIIQDLNLYADERVLASADGKARRLRSHIDVTFEANVASFRVAFVNPDPAVAQKVTERLGALFVQGDSHTGDTVEADLASVLQLEIEDTKRQLAERGRKLSEVKRRAAGQLSSNRSAVHQPEGEQAALRAVEVSMTQARERRAALQEEITRERSGADVDPATETDLSESEQGDRAPAGQEPVRAKRLLALETELAAVDRALANGEAEAARLRAVGSRAAQDPGPSRRAELVTLTREYDTLRQRYSELLLRQEDAAGRAKSGVPRPGDQFAILEPASRPQRSENQTQRLAALVGRGLGGLGLGLCLTLFLEHRHARFHCEADVLRVLDLPVLGLIPIVDSQPGTCGGPDRHREPHGSGAH